MEGQVMVGQGWVGRGLGAEEGWVEVGVHVYLQHTVYIAG
jgi:hypothetical protein